MTMTLTLKAADRAVTLGRESREGLDVSLGICLVSGSRADADVVRQVEE